MALEFIKLVKDDSPVAQVGSYGFFKLGVESGGGGGDLTFSRVFSENTPEQIAAVSAKVSANNMTSAQVTETYGWNIGDTIDITLTTGELIQMRIIGFNHDDKSDGSGKAGITLEMVDCLQTQYMMSNLNTASNTNSWYASPIRTTVAPNFKGQLPIDWQNVIKPVDKTFAHGGGANYKNTYTFSDAIFLLASIEVFGNGHNAQNGLDEGTQYEYYNKGYSAIKNLNWWLRSCAKNTTDFCIVNTSGVPNTARSNYTLGVSFAFCI